MPPPWTESGGGLAPLSFSGSWACFTDPARLLQLIPAASNDSLARTSSISPPDHLAGEVKIAAC